MCHPGIARAPDDASTRVPEPERRVRAHPLAHGLSQIRRHRVRGHAAPGAVAYRGGVRSRRLSRLVSRAVVGAAAIACSWRSRRPGARGRPAVPAPGREPGGLRHGRCAASRDHRHGRGDDRRDRGADRRRGRRLHPAHPVLRGAGGCGTQRPGADGPVGRRPEGLRRRPRDPVRPPRERPVPRPGPALCRPRLRLAVPVEQRAPGDLRGPDAAAAQAVRPRRRAAGRDAEGRRGSDPRTRRVAQLLPAAQRGARAPRRAAHLHPAGRWRAVRVVPPRTRPGVPRRPVDPHPGAARGPHAGRRRGRARRQVQPPGADGREPRPRRARPDRVRGRPDGVARPDHGAVDPHQHRIDPRSRRDGEARARAGSPDRRGDRLPPPAPAQHRRRDRAHRPHRAAEAGQRRERFRQATRGARRAAGLVHRSPGQGDQPLGRAGHPRRSSAARSPCSSASTCRRTASTSSAAP